MKRIAFGIIWFFVFWLGAGMIGGGIAGILAQSHTSTPAAANQTFSEGYSRGYEVGQVAGREFGRKYGLLILGGALIVSIAGTVAGVLPGTRRKGPRPEAGSIPRNV
jgi:predicted phage tail protein